MGSNWSYCNFTTDFYLVIDRLPMGPITALVMLLVRAAVVHFFHHLVIHVFSNYIPNLYPE